MNCVKPSLGYGVSKAIWHSSGTRLMVIARPDVLARIELPVDEVRPDLTEVVESPTPTRPWQDIKQNFLAKERERSLR